MRLTNESGHLFSMSRFGLFLFYLRMKRRTELIDEFKLGLWILLGLIEYCFETHDVGIIAKSHNE